MSSARWISAVLLVGTLAGSAAAGDRFGRHDSWRRSPGHCTVIPVRHRGAWNQFEIGYDAGWRQGYGVGVRGRGAAPCAPPRCEIGSRQYQRGFQHGFQDGYASGLRAGRRSFSFTWRGW